MIFAFLSSILAVLMALALLLFLSFSIWDCSNIVGPLLVLFGITREFWLLLKKLPENASEQMKSKKHKQEVWAVLVVMAGVAVELIVVPHSLLEVSELKVKTESLRQANDALELEIQPRRITEEKRQAIIEAFRHLHFAEKTDKIKITSEGYDQESGVFAQQIAEALAGAGISVQLDKNSTSERQLDFGVKYQFKYPPNPAVIAIAKSLKKADIIPAELNTNWSLGDFIMEIWVGAKPLPEVKNSN